jgi:hypothetical protein
MTEKPGRVDAERLRKLGFGEDLINEAVARADRGLLGIEPPPALLNRLLERARRLTPKKAEERSADPAWKRLPAWIYATADPATETALARTYAHCVSMGTMPARYAESLKYAVQQHERPLVILENHNVIDPAWWREDRVFKQIRSACRLVNKTALELGGPRSALVVVLRSAALSAYPAQEIEQLDQMLQESMSDIYWIAASKAGQYATKDVVVIGDECVFQIKQPVRSPAEALGMMISSETETNAQEQRRSILEVISKAAPIKSEGVLEPSVAQAIARGGVRAALEMVLDR